MVKVHSIRDTHKQTAPTLSWVPVTGPDGRVHMEMRWHVAPKVGSVAPRRAA